MNKQEVAFGVDYPNIGEIIVSLRKIEHILNNPDKFVPPTENDLNNLALSIEALLAINESKEFKFEAVVGNFISRSEAKPLRKEQKEWADNIFRSGVVKNMLPLYVSTSQIEKLLNRTNRSEDFIEITLGKKDKILCIMMAAVKPNGDRIDDPDLTKRGTQRAEDVLDDMRPCPEPKCPVGLEK